MKVLLIDNYDSFTYNLYQYIEDLGARCLVVRNDRISVERIRKMNPGRIVISPGPGRPEDSGISPEAIGALGPRIPILGVCLGHQAIGMVFGGKVIRAEKMMHGKTSRIYHDGKGIYRGVENPFEATRYHSLVVQKQGLPSCLRITSRTRDGIIMGLAHRRYPIQGVQFHPESVMTQNGKRLIENFLKGKP